MIFIYVVYLYENYLYVFLKRNDLRKEILKLGNEVVNRPVLSFSPRATLNDVKFQ